jgi:hypothetical protein
MIQYISKSLALTNQIGVNKRKSVSLMSPNFLEENYKPCVHESCDDEHWGQFVEIDQVPLAKPIPTKRTPYFPIYKTILEQYEDSTEKLDQWYIDSYNPKSVDKSLLSYLLSYDITSCFPLSFMTSLITKCIQILLPMKPLPLLTNTVEPRRQ